MAFFDVKVKVLGHLTKNIPRVKHAIETVIVAETFLKAKREANREKHGKVDPNSKTMVQVKAYLEFLTLDLTPQTGGAAIDIPQFLLANLAHFGDHERFCIFAIINYINRTEPYREQFTLKLCDPGNPIILSLLNQFDNENISSTINDIVSELIREPRVAKRVLTDEKLTSPILKNMQSQRFDLSANSFKILHTLIFKSPQTQAMSSEYLKENFDSFVSRYNVLLSSRNYITIRQSNQLLGEILLTRVNFKFMVKYTSSEEQLRITLKSLFHKQPRVVAESFHIFKIFVANPKKEKGVHDLLFREKEKLIKLLTDFRGIPQDEDNENLLREKSLCIKKLTKLVCYEEHLAKKKAARAAKEAKKAALAAANA